MEFDVKNVKRFGAVGNGSGDDTAAIQDALDSLKDSGGTVFFPAGVYPISKCLLYYSNQRLIFENGAVLMRANDKMMYILANSTTSDQGGYSATHNVDIIGATFDGNAEIDYKATLLNNSHMSDLRVKNCKFRNGHTWHFYECNSSKYVHVDGCIFENSMRGTVKSEYIQLDSALIGAYGTTPIAPDDTVCSYITVSNCRFECSGFSPAIGNHSRKTHNNIKIYSNSFIGGSGNRGNIDLMSTVHSLDIYGNSFENADKGVWHTDDLPAPKDEAERKKYFHDKVVYDRERPWFVHGNRFTNVNTVCADDVVSFGNILNGKQI